MKLFKSVGGDMVVLAIKQGIMKGALIKKANQAAKGIKNIFGKAIASTATRMGKDGKVIEIIFKDGSKIDISATRVKEWIPNKHPNAPAGTLQKTKFENFLPDSKGHKRTPTKSEIDLLNSLSK